ncbi:MAG TPA: hypothetical protein VK923_19475 [Euzebyales bacterium]|nr:hypothetical protein [Euzebyales bacterium]
MTGSAAPSASRGDRSVDEVGEAVSTELERHEVLEVGDDVALTSAVLDGWLQHLVTALGPPVVGQHVGVAQREQGVVAGSPDDGAQRAGGDPEVADAAPRHARPGALGEQLGLDRADGDDVGRHALHVADPHRLRHRVVIKRCERLLVVDVDPQREITGRPAPGGLLADPDALDPVPDRPRPGVPGGLRRFRAEGLGRELLGRQRAGDP